MTSKMTQVAERQDAIVHADQLFGEYSILIGKSLIMNSLRIPHMLLQELQSDHSYAASKESEFMVLKFRW